MAGLTTTTYVTNSFSCIGAIEGWAKVCPFLVVAFKGAGSPDVVIDVGDDYSKWTEGETRKIDLNRWRLPDLVGEVSDTTLASDLDEKKAVCLSWDC